MASIIFNIPWKEVSISWHFLYSTTKKKKNELMQRRIQKFFFSVSLSNIQLSVFNIFLIFIFQIVVLNQEDGTAELRARHRLNCEDKKSYQFDIQAISCSGTYSDRYDDVKICGAFET